MCGQQQISGISVDILSFILSHTLCLALTLFIMHYGYEVMRHSGNSHLILSDRSGVSGCRTFSYTPVVQRRIGTTTEYIRKVIQACQYPGQDTSPKQSLLYSFCDQTTC